MTVTGRSSRRASGWLTSESCTVGALQQWVTPSRSKSSQIAPGSTERTQTCVPAAAVTAQVKHQPLQWNIGSVQR